MNAPIVAAQADHSAGHFLRVRQQTMDLCAGLGAEDLLVQSMPDASPGKWHLAHTSWFFEQFVLHRDIGYRSPHPEWHYLFNSYYESVGERQPRPLRGMLTRPSLETIHAYRAHVDAAM